ncbi:hypothetical protein VMUT_1722 [Vulcanisaeta moutnovskia 768-28]|uniref:DUF8196 domain-containing protein n=1 Tax=Vulcanisaeta moutnovskia (strain 768-28) TaxID=985053 RepID=F0QUU2_VULM7|nr:hypothetical protein [Vulcanisaeta moutnovskia]ADY01924.1 hypothetical protein VMUT_1722 [Vulcanisaeta moutnovskia 768-28]
MSLRDEFLRLLREDEVFRLAVIGLLGISDVQSSLRRLVDVVGRLVDGQEALARNQSVMMEVLNKVLEAVQRLTENEEKLWENQNKLWEENNKIWQEIRALREGQYAMREDIRRLWEENNKIWKELRGLRREVSGVSNTVGVLVERDARHYLPAWVRAKVGVNVDRLRRARVEDIGEFDGYAEADNRVIAVEVKATLRVRDVKDFVDKVGKLRSAKAGKEVIAIIAYVNESRDTGKAIELARLNGIKVVKHHGEDDFEELT